MSAVGGTPKFPCACSIDLEEIKYERLLTTRI
jgi:hypothetical protein